VHCVQAHIQPITYLTGEQKKLSSHFSEEQNFSALLAMHG
jgi:hypothetical protein